MLVSPFCRTCRNGEAYEAATDRVLRGVSKTSEATVLGATEILHRPFLGTAVVELLLGDGDLASTAAGDPVETVPGAPARPSERCVTSSDPHAAGRRST